MSPHQINWCKIIKIWIAYLSMLKVEWSDLDHYCPSYAEIGAKNRVSGTFHKGIMPVPSGNKMFLKKQKYLDLFFEHTTKRIRQFGAVMAELYLKW